MAFEHTLSPPCMTGFVMTGLPSLERALARPGHEVVCHRPHVTIDIILAPQLESVLTTKLASEAEAAQPGYLRHNTLVIASKHNPTDIGLRHSPTELHRPEHSEGIHRLATRLRR
jgi:hypothetical protein